MDKYFKQVSPTQRYFAGGFMMAAVGKAAIGITAAAVGVYSLNKYFNGGQNKNFPSLQGKTIVITGGNTGLGYFCAREMVKLGPSKIIIACRD